MMKNWASVDVSCGEEEGNRKGFNLTCPSMSISSSRLHLLLGWLNKSQQRFSLYYIFLSLGDDTRTSFHADDDLCWLCSQSWCYMRLSFVSGKQLGSSHTAEMIIMMSFIAWWTCLFQMAPLSMESNQQATLKALHDLIQSCTVKCRFISFRLYSICGEIKLSTIQSSHRTLHARPDFPKSFSKFLNGRFTFPTPFTNIVAKWSFTSDDDSLTVLTGLSEFGAMRIIFKLSSSHALP